MVIKRLFRWFSATRKRRILSSILSLLILFTSVRWVFLNPGVREVQAADVVIKLNEGYGNSARDGNGNVSAGTITNAAWKTKDLCFDDMCLYFDGTGDYVSFSDDDDLDMTDTGTTTVVGWFRTGDISSGQRTLVAKYDTAPSDGGYKIYMNSSGSIVFGIDNDNSGFPSDSVTSTKAYDDNKWHHFAAVKNGTSSITLYVDAKNVGTDSSITSSSPANDDTFYIGIDGDGSSNGWVGFIDEIKVYASARTADEIKTDYLAVNTDRGTAVKFGESQNWVSDGLVGYWKFDETSGNAADSSGNGNDLTASGSPSYVNAKYGYGLDLESGSTQYQYIADNSSLSITGDLTISGWVKPESTTSSTQFNIAGKWDGDNESYLLAQYGDEIRFYIDSASNYVTTDSVNLSTGTWYHVIGVYSALDQTVKIYINGDEEDTTTTGTIPSSIGDDAGRLHIGAEDSGGGGGSIDEQVSAGGDDGHCEQATFYSSDTSVTVGTATGKENNTFARFTGVTIPADATITTAYISIYATTSSGSNLSLVYADDQSSPPAPADCADVINATSTTNQVSWNGTVTTSSWNNSPSLVDVIQELVDTYDYSSGGTIMILHMDNGTSNGNYWDMRSYEYTGNLHGYKLHIEYGGASNYYDGILDDVRIYNRAFTSSEVTDLYNWAPGPFVYYKMDEGSWNNNCSSDTVFDSSGNGYHGKACVATTGPVGGADGKFGNAGEFDGADDYIDVSVMDPQTYDNLSIMAWYKSSSQVVGRPVGGPDDEYVYVDWESDNDALYFGPTDDNTTDELRFLIQENGGGLQYTYGTSDIVDEQWHHIAAVRGDGRVKLYVDGVLETDDAESTYANTTITINSASGPFIGDYPTDTEQVHGKIDDFKIYRYARTASQIVEDMNAGHPAPGSPVGSPVSYLEFDEGFGDTANDTSPHGNDGDLAGTCPGGATCPSWTNDGKYNKALSFDGTDDYLSIASTADFDVAAGGEFSAFMWFKKTGDCDSTAANDAEVFIHRYHNTISAFRWWMGCLGVSDSEANKLFFQWPDTDSTYAYIISDATINDGEWHHAGMVYDGPNEEFRMYLDGVSQGSQGSVLTTDVDSTNPMCIGNYGSTCTDSYDYHGEIDELKIYNIALTDDQAKVEYNRGVSQLLGASSTDSSGNPSWSADNEYCPPGQGSTCTPPIAEWKMDENSGTTSTYDTSENNATGTLTGSMTEEDWIDGKVGSALQFDGQNDYVDVSSGVNTVEGKNTGTIEAWFKTTSTTTYPIFTLTDGNVNMQLMQIMVGDTTGTYSDDSLSFVLGSASWLLRMYVLNGHNAYLDGEWHHVVVATGDGDNRIYMDGVRQSVTFLTGSVSTNQFSNITGQSDMRIASRIYGTGSDEIFFDGAVDEVRVYDYARSDAQVAWSYNKGKPVGWWEIDECTGSGADSIHDSSGKDHHGNLTIGAFDSNVAPGWCTSGDSSHAWYNGATGVYNASIDVDGYDDYITISDNNDFDITKEITLSAWFNTDVIPGAPNCDPVVHKDSNGSGYNPPDYGRLYDIVLCSNYIQFGLFNGTSRYSARCATPIQTNTWYHVVGTFDGDNLKCYLNGSLEKTTSQSTTITTSTRSIFIGAGRRDSGNAEYFNGQIDDVRIYNYALTPQQIKGVYNFGALFFGD